MLHKLKLLTYLSFALSILYSCSGKKETTSKQEDTLRLISYNVWYGFTLVPDRKPQWLEWMNQQQPDVVSLQELNEYTPELLSEDAETWGHSYTALLKTDGFPTGVTSRYPIEDVQRTLEGFHHGLLRAKIKGIYFYIIHLHPSNWEVRVQEINRILDDIRTLPSEAPVVLAGDFNTFSHLDSGFYAHGRLEPFFQQRDNDFNENNLNHNHLDYTVLDRLMKNGFVDTEYLSRDNDYDFTGSFPTLIEKEGDHGDQRRLDYVFINENLKDNLIHAEIIADQTTLILSDHLPVIADIKIPKQDDQ